MQTADPGMGRSVRQMFTDIASRYDLLNRLITFGQDLGWRRDTVKQLDLAAGDRVIDVGCGTGDMACEVLRQKPDATVFACDFTPEMIQVGRQRRMPSGIFWLLADAEQLPFSPGAFAAACSGFLLRNVQNVDTVLGEQHRVLREGGIIAALDTSPGQTRWLAPFQAVHFRLLIPLLGWLLVRDASAYRYLPASTRAFLGPEELAKRLRKAGFSRLSYARRMFGSIALHWGAKKTQLG